MTEFSPLFFHQCQFRLSIQFQQDFQKKLFIPSFSRKAVFPQTVLPTTKILPLN